MNLEEIPVVDGFEVVVRDGHIEYVDGPGARLAWFPAWEHADRDLRHFVPADVPLGTSDEPYDDADENWRITIFEHDGFIHIFEADDPKATDYPRSYRVPRDEYIAAWARIMDEYNPISPLDATGDLPEE